MNTNTNVNTNKNTTIKYKTVVYKFQYNNKIYYTEAYSESDAKVALLKKIDKFAKSINYNLMINDMKDDDIKQCELYKAINTLRATKEELTILWDKYNKHDVIFLTIKKNDTLTKEDLSKQKDKQQ